MIRPTENQIGREDELMRFTEKSFTFYILWKNLKSLDVKSYSEKYKMIIMYHKNLQKPNIQSEEGVCIVWEDTEDLIRKYIEINRRYGIIRRVWFEGGTWILSRSSETLEGILKYMVNSQCFPVINLVNKDEENEKYFANKDPRYVMKENIINL